MGRRSTWLGLLALSFCLGVPASAGDAPPAAGQGQLQYEVGGPLEGPVLSLYPTHFGEEPGHPGCVPELIGTGKSFEDMGTVHHEWANQGLFPQYQLYPGSIENFRAYWLKYVPVRPMVDQASLLRNWDAPNIPHQGQAKVESYAAPLYWVPRHSEPQATGKVLPAALVIRCAVKSPVFDLDLGELPVGMYVVRVIGAVPTEQLTVLRKPIYMAMTVNDGPEGKASLYRMQIGYVDELYSVAEFYFQAPAKRKYQAQIYVDQGSATDLLVHNIDVHDVFAGCLRRPIKKQMTLETVEERQRFRAAHKPEKPVAAKIEDMPGRLQADEALWNSFPPLNVQLGGVYGLNQGYGNKVVFGWNGRSLDELHKEHGAWKLEPYGVSPVLISNEQLKLSYTMADLAAHKPLPDPYPVKDDGAGIVTPASGQQPQQNFTVIADAANQRLNIFYRQMVTTAARYRETGDAQAGWAAAVMLCRAAWQFPAIDGTQSLTAVVTNPGGFERDLRSRRRDLSLPPGIGNGFNMDQLLTVYDQVFDVIQGNRELAQSIGRFLPWVQNPDDVVAMVDVHLVQYMAKRLLRYNYLYDNYPAWIAGPAAVLADRGVTDPWLRWLFTKAYVYPNPPSGLADMISTGNDRDGIGYIASYSYGLGEQAARNGQLLTAYLRAGGDPVYDLTNARYYPKVTQATRFIAWQSRLAGLHFPRIGDVAGPDKPYAYLFDNQVELARSGWQWTQEPAFAFILFHYGQRKGETDQQWQQIQQAAGKLARAPWLDNRSRVAPNWYSVLESGLQFNDYRFRSSAMLRIGQGYGHQHNDTLDLQITAHGLPMTIDGGQRPGYSKPVDRTTRVHNLVEVDGKDWLGHSWTRSLSDAQGAPYMLVESVPPKDFPNVKSYRRQVALIDVDQGSGYKELTPEQQGPKPKLELEVVTPNSYIFDVVRVAGGKLHTYCFHGPLEDQLESNAADQQPYEKLSPADQEYVSMFRNEPIADYPIAPQRWGGVAAANFQATWRMAQNIPGTGMGEDELAPNFNPQGPRKFLRLHLLGQQGARVLTGWMWCRQWSYGFNNMYVQQRHEQESDVVFPAIIEPFAGESFIRELRLLEVADNSSGAERAVAAQVQTTNGHDDLCFADLPGAPSRKVGPWTIAGEFAYVSRDQQGLRQASLTGGSVLQGEGLLLQLAQAQRQARIVRVDYPARQMVVDQPLPPGQLLRGRTFEVGVPGRMTTYTIDQVELLPGGQSQITVARGADRYLSRIIAVDAAKQQVHCVLGMAEYAGSPCPGIDRHLVASNESSSKFWRAQYLGNAQGGKVYTFQLDGPVSAADFGDRGGFRLWEFGVGDELRLSSFASMQRVEAGRYLVQGDGELTVGLPGKSLSVSQDGKSFRPVAGKAAGALVQATLVHGDFDAQGRVYLQVK